MRVLTSLNQNIIEIKKRLNLAKFVKTEITEFDRNYPSFNRKKFSKFVKPKQPITEPNIFFL